MLKTCRVVLALVLMGVLSACTSFQTATDQSTSETVASLQAGDTVKVVLTDNTTEQFTVTENNPDELLGDGVRIAKKDIRLVVVEKLDAGKSAVAGITVVGTLISIGMLMLIAAF